MPILPSSSLDDTRTQSTVHATHANWALLPLLLCLLALLFFLSLTLGSTHIGYTDIVSIILGEDSLSPASRIVRHVRLPRTLAATLCGMALALSGALLQKVLHNPLAGPSIIGVNSGAGLFALVGSAFFPHLVAMGSLFSFLGALGASLLVYALARRSGSTHLTIILAGVAVSSLLGSCTDALLTFEPETQMGRLDFLIGSFAHVPYSQVVQTAPYIGGAVTLSLLLSHDLNILGLGDEVALSLGLEVGRTRFLALMLASLLSASVVSMCGLIGFVGLVVPHMVRSCIGEDSPLFLLFTCLVGAVITVSCDLIARTLFSPYELPVGIVLSFLGSPFFLFLLFTRNRRGHNA
ncbi:MAG TPA: iron ABC transporter permease [Sphaerochaeta sp.]|nr:iron ABC transporter permease [Sphaerochaeta sp.]